MAMQDFINSINHEAEQFGKDLNTLAGMVGCTVVNTNLWCGSMLHNICTGEVEKARYNIGEHDYIILQCKPGETYKVRRSKKTVSKYLQSPWANDPFAWETVKEGLTKEEAFAYVQKMGL